MDRLYLIAIIAGQRVAIATSPIESVVELDAIVPVPRVAAHIAGLAALRSRVLTIIDCVASLALAQRPPAEAPRAVIVTIDGHHYGLLVDAVRDVVTIAAAPRPTAVALGGGWGRVVRGTVEHDGEALLLLDPAALVAGPAALAA